MSQHAGDPQCTCGPGEVGWEALLDLLGDDVENFRRCLSDRLRLCLQPLSPSSQHRLKQLTDKHGSGKIYQVTGTVVASRDLDLNLAKGELVAVLSEADTRGDRRRWLVDAGGDDEPIRCSFFLKFFQVITNNLFRS